MAGSKKYSINLYDLEKRGDRYFDPAEDIPFTGHYYWMYENGKVAEEGYLKEGVWQGRLKLYNEKGVLIVEAEYRNGLRHGQVTSYYDSGNIKAMYTLREGKRQGRFILWYDRGGKKFEAQYNEDLLDGKQVKYFISGKKNMEVTFRDGKEHGRKTIWNENGEVIFTGDFEDGELL